VRPGSWAVPRRGSQVWCLQADIVNGMVIKTAINDVEDR